MIKNKKTRVFYEEVSEKKTSKLGYILLIVMFFFIIGAGEKVFDDLRYIPSVPVEPSDCVVFSDYDLRSMTSVWCDPKRDIDLEFGLSDKFFRIKPDIEEVARLNESIYSKRRELSILERDFELSGMKYDLSLQEKIAGTADIIDTDISKKEVSDLQSKISAVKEDIDSMIDQRNQIVANISADIESLKQAYDFAYKHYEKRYTIYELQVSLLSLVFVLPLLWLSVRYYLRLKNNNSPYTIILTSVVAALSVLFLHVVGVFLYYILPMEIIMDIWNLLWYIPFFRFIAYYGVVVLVILFFGGIVYYIQKRVFNPKQVAIRRLRDKKCPDCDFRVNDNNIFCPNCGLQLKERCAQCGELKFKHLRFCPHCGVLRSAEQHKQ